MEIIRLRDQGLRVGGRVRGQKVHEQIDRALKASRRVQLDFAGVESVGATFLDEVLGALVAWHGSAILRSLVFTSCSKGVEASIVKALRDLAPLRGILQFS